MDISGMDGAAPGAKTDSASSNLGKGTLAAMDVLSDVDMGTRIPLDIPRTAYHRKARKQHDDHQKQHGAHEHRRQR
jgi:hypothetical protein